MQRLKISQPIVMVVPSSPILQDGEEGKNEQPFGVGPDAEPDHNSSIVVLVALTSQPRRLSSPASR